MADKYLKNASGVVTEQAAIITSAGAGDSGKIIALDAAGKLDTTFLPTGIGAEIKLLPATEALSAGNLVNIYDASGTPSVRKADATTAGKEANGFVLSSVSNAATATVYVAGIITGLSGLTGGSKYYLHTTAGGITVTSPSSAGNISQSVGVALSATELAFQPKTAITLA